MQGWGCPIPGGGPRPGWMGLGGGNQVDFQLPSKPSREGIDVWGRAATSRGSRKARTVQPEAPAPSRLMANAQRNGWKGPRRLLEAEVTWQSVQTPPFQRSFPQVAGKPRGFHHGSRGSRRAPAAGAHRGAFRLRSTHLILSLRNACTSFSPCRKTQSPSSPVAAAGGEASPVIHPPGPACALLGSASRPRRAFMR